MNNEEKIGYEVDPHNRLVYRKAGSSSEVSEFRQILDGRFNIDEDNCLIYHIKKSNDLNIPQQIRFSGNFSIDKEHNLIFTLDKWNNQVQADRLIISAEIIDVNSNELVFSVSTKNSSGREGVYLLKIKGAWQADEYNRLTFNIEREKGLSEKIVFEGIWDINKQNQIMYSYNVISSRRKSRIEKVLVFRGYWDILSKNRISYVLNKSLASQFDFKVGVVNFFQKALIYEIGIGAGFRKKIVSIFGTWKIDNNIGLLFEIKYDKTSIHGIVFQATCRFKEDNCVELQLKNSLGEDLGIGVKLSKRILKDQGEAFLKTSFSKNKTEILVGGGFRW